MKKIITLTILFGLLGCAYAYAASPVVFFSDLESGPKTGGQNNKGAFVTVFGKNFGATRGTSYVSIGSGQADNYPFWSDTKISFQLGTNVATGNIMVTTSEGTSNGVSFNIRSCDIYFVSTSGNDSNDGSYGSPWRHLSKARSVMSGGDICYIRGGTYTSSGENSAGELFYVSGSYPWGGSASNGNPHCIIGYPGETATLQASSDGEGIVNYVGSDSDCANLSNVVFANLVLNANNKEANFTWRGRTNGASTTYRVKNIRVVNLEVKNYLNTGAGGGTALIEVGGDGPVDNLKVLGCNVHDMDSSSRLDHGIYISAGGSNIEIGWNTVYNIKKVNSTGGDGNAGFGIQTYRGSSSNYANLNNLKLHDNLVYECPSRGGINLSDYTISSQVYNNIVYNCGYDGTEEGYGLRVSVDSGPGTHYIYNNTFYNCGRVNDSSGSSIIGFMSGDALHVYLRNNIFIALANQSYAYNGLASGLYTTSNNDWYGNGSKPVWATGELNSDPQVFDLTNHDFHLKLTSPAKDAGYDTTAIVASDYDGVVRPQSTAVDIGAYELSYARIPNVVKTKKVSP